MLKSSDPRLLSGRKAFSWTVLPHWKTMIRYVLGSFFTRCPEPDTSNKQPMPPI